MSQHYPFGVWCAAVFLYNKRSIKVPPHVGAKEEKHNEVTNANGP
jgi:hypothetical protein